MAFSHLATVLALALHILPPCGATRYGEAGGPDCRPGVTAYSCNLTFCQMSDGSYRLSPFNSRRHK